MALLLADAGVEESHFAKLSSVFFIFLQHWSGSLYPPSPVSFFQGNNDTVTNDGMAAIFWNQTRPPAIFYDLGNISFESFFSVISDLRRLSVASQLRRPSDLWKSEIRLRTTPPYISIHRNTFSTDYLLSSNFSHLTSQLKLNLADPEVKPLIPLLARDVHWYYVRTVCVRLPEVHQML